MKLSLNFMTPKFKSGETIRCLNSKFLVLEINNTKYKLINENGSVEEEETAYIDLHFINSYSDIEFKKNYFYYSFKSYYKLFFELTLE